MVLPGCSQGTLVQTWKEKRRFCSMGFAADLWNKSNESKRILILSSQKSGKFILYACLFLVVCFLFHKFWHTSYNNGLSCLHRVVRIKNTSVRSYDNKPSLLPEVNKLIINNRPLESLTYKKTSNFVTTRLSESKINFKQINVMLISKRICHAKQVSKLVQPTLKHSCKIWMKIRLSMFFSIMANK